MQADFYEFLKSDPIIELLVCKDDKQAFVLAQVALFVGIKPFILSDFRAKKGDDLRSFQSELNQLCKALASYHECKSKKLLISPFHTILNKLPSKDQLKALCISKTDKNDPKDLANTLLNFGYERVDIVQDEKEFSLRADILDIFALNEDKPFRLSFFMDECESIRYFDLFTQKSEPKELDFIKITPFLMGFDDEKMQLMQESLRENAFSQNIVNDFNSIGFWCLDGMKDYLELDFYTSCELKSDDDLNLDFLNKRLIPAAKEYKDLNLNYNQELFNFHKNKKITIIARNEALIKDLDFSFDFVKSDIVLNILSTKELIISLNKEGKKKKIRRSKLLVDELKRDDFVVHEDYGVARFEGLIQLQIQNRYQDFVCLIYQNNDKLYLPVQNLYLIDKYLGANASIPSLDKLGKANFLKIKERLKQKLFIIAQNIVALAAKRSLISPKPVEIDPFLMQSFVNAAGFEYTIDQKKICEDFVKDFAKNKVFDRLISGDVGFGKTELATYAALACLHAGYNVLFFVPTTLLSAQHHKSISKRLKPFDIEVLRLDRFSSAKEKKAVKQALVDEKKASLIIGTHTLLNIECKNLALVIIDEEHKFGVKQKEKLRELSKSAHIISMSATPIPRSLNQALSQVKSYSKLSTPPQDRLDIRTIFKEYSKTLLKEAILRELRRGGQVFFIHNHIASIKLMQKQLQELIPSLKILVLHSKIDAKTTEESMLAFEKKEYELLLCTSIVESGIDLPNVNTIIINNANKFGIADLHQLRGRVGRGKARGFCYLFIESKDQLNEQALKRLLSLESNSFLGAGELLAYHDLELRGGGNLLGVDQSGHIEQIGYSLYLKMLEDELNKLMKKSSLEDEADTKIELKLNVNAFLSSELIPQERVRLELYRRLSRAKSSFELNELEAELIDRFGSIDRYSKQFLELLHIKILACNDFKLISNYGQNISLINKNDEKIVLKANSGDDDEVLLCLLKYLKNR